MMKKFRIVPDIYQCDTFKDFLDSFPLNSDDLIITNRYIYDPFIKKFNLPCHFIYQEEHGLGEPSDIMVDAILTSIKSISYKRVVGIGGGTVIDIAKVLSIKKFDCCDEIFDDPSKIRKDKKLIIIPTTCGTGSEVTRSSIISSTKRKTKMRMAYDAYFADIAVLIPEFISTLPYKFFALSSIDALIHAVESYLSPEATPYTDLFSEKAIKILLQSFVTISKNGVDSRRTVERDVLLASNFAGISFGNAGCGAVHALAFPLSGRYGVVHGESNYQFFVQVLKLYYKKKPEGKISYLIEMIVDILQCHTDQALECLAVLLNDIWKIKSLSCFGMGEDEIEEFSKEVYLTLQPVLSTSYVKLSQDELAEIYRKLL